jgi:hypothetical protein
MLKPVFRAWIFLFTTTLGALLLSCGTGECVGSIPVPTLRSVQPASLDSQVASTSISLSGSGFVSWSNVFLNSVSLDRTVVDSHHISATVTSGELFVAGTSEGVSIWVVNPGQIGGGILGCSNGGSSQAVPITIK